MSKFDFKKLMEEHPDEARKIKINALLRRERHKKDKLKLKKKKAKKGDKGKGGQKKSNKLIPGLSSNFESSSKTLFSNFIILNSVIEKVIAPIHLKSKESKEESIKIQEDKPPLLAPPAPFHQDYISKSSIKSSKSEFF